MKNQGHSIRTLVVAVGLMFAIGLTTRISAQNRVPGEHWMRYVNASQAGFDASKLEAARKTWEGLPSSAFMLVADGAVVASWGDVERRFMCHSVRKSFLSALYGIYWDRGSSSSTRHWPILASMMSRIRSWKPKSEPGSWTC